MGDLDFSPVFREINSIIKGDRHSLMYFGQHFGKKIIILKHQSLTLMLVLAENDFELTIEFTKCVSSREIPINSGIKIVAKDDIILLLDGDGNLWRLINAFEFSDEKDECFYSLSEECFYEWVPFKQFKFQKIFDVTVFEDGFAFLGLSKNTKKLKTLKLIPSNSWEDFTFEDLNENESESYYLTNLRISSKETTIRDEIGDSNETLLVTDKLNGTTYICAKNSKVYMINVSCLPLVSLLVLESVKCLVLCFQNGKLVFVRYDVSLDIITDWTVFLSKRLICIEKFESDEPSLIWSDGINLHHTLVKFEFDKPSFVKLVHLQVNNDIHGVISLLKIQNDVLAVTINNFYYHIKINNLIKVKQIQKSSEELLSDIFDAGLRIEELNKEIDIACDFIEAKEIIQNNDLTTQVELEWEEKWITLKSYIKKRLRKDFWRIKLLNKFEKREFVEMINLETDLSEGITVKFETDLLKKGQVEVSLVGDFGNEFDLLFVNLGKVGNEKSNLEGQKLAKNLYEICKKRNPYFKG